MKNPVFNKQHITEYFTYGFIAAVAYIIPVLFFLKHNEYQNFYYLYIGNGLFMVVIFSYAYRLVYHPYDKKRAVTMLIAGNMATLAGIIISLVFDTLSILFFFPGLVSSLPIDKIVEGAPGTIQLKHPGGLLSMIAIDAVIGNGGMGALISVVTAYAGKLNQA